MKSAISSLQHRPLVGVLVASLALLSVASIVAVKSTVVEAGHERSAPYAAWPFLAVLAVTSVVAVLAVLPAVRAAGGAAHGAVATGIRWSASIAAGAYPGLAAALYLWGDWFIREGRTAALNLLFQIAVPLGRPVDAIVYMLAGGSVHSTDLLPRGFVELWLLTGLVSVVLWSAVGMLLLAGARRIARYARRPVSHTS